VKLRNPYEYAVVVLGIMTISLSKNEVVAFATMTDQYLNLRRFRLMAGIGSAITPARNCYFHYY